jgi:hypothetical protein
MTGPEAWAAQSRYPRASTLIRKTGDDFPHFREAFAPPRVIILMMV